MKGATKKALRDAWHTAEPIEQIAKRRRISTRQINRFWAAEKIAGRLPDTARPHFADRTTLPACAVPLDDDFDEHFDFDDDTPIEGLMGLRIPESDPLLAALCKHDIDPAAQVMPTDWLRLDLDVHVAPTPEMLAEFCRARDTGHVCTCADARKVKSSVIVRG